MSTVEKVVLFLGHTFSGRNHDYAMLKEEFSSEKDWFKELQIWVDLGYMGMPKDYRSENIFLPHKKPRKSKKKPETSLTDKQKEENRALSRVRIFVENAIGGIKRYNILVHRFRNHKSDFADDVISVCAGLWNFSLANP